MLVKSEDSLENDFSQLHSVTSQILVCQLGSQLVQEVLVRRKVSAHMVRLLLEDAVVVDHQVVDKAVHVRSQTITEGCFHGGVSGHLSKKVKTLSVADESSFRFEVVRFEPGGQAVEDRYLRGESLLALELVNQVDGAALARELLYLAIVEHCGCEHTATQTPHLLVRVSEYKPQQLSHATHQAQVQIVPGVQLCQVRQLLEELDDLII